MQKIKEILEMLVDNSRKDWLEIPEALFLIEKEIKEMMLSEEELEKFLRDRHDDLTSGDGSFPNWDDIAKAIHLAQEKKINEIC